MNRSNEPSAEAVSEPKWGGKCLAEMMLDAAQERPQASLGVRMPDVCAGFVMSARGVTGVEAHLVEVIQPQAQGRTQDVQQKQSRRKMLNHGSDGP